MLNTVLLFGGAGFIGQHFARHLLDNAIAAKVILADIAPLQQRFDLSGYLESGKVEVVVCDVRTKIDLCEQLAIESCRDQIDLIGNFAAIHREPGHQLEEYYHTNLPGAEHVCDWAEQVGCERLIFTSSIAPYGPTETPKTEKDIPTPVTGYGGSKLAAEKIHQGWQLKDPQNRRLVIVRPGVVFGAGEGGNVSRLIKAVLKGYFFYMGNQETRKAGTYVKELCRAMWWVTENAAESVTVFNMSMNPGPTMKEYVEVICRTASVSKKVVNVPYRLLYAMSMIIDPIARSLKINQPISPVRMRKLIKSNHIVPQKLAEIGYEYEYSFEQAMVDWRKEAPQEWLV